MSLSLYLPLPLSRWTSSSSSPMLHPPVAPTAASTFSPAIDSNFKFLSSPSDVQMPLALVERPALHSLICASHPPSYASPLFSPFLLYTEYRTAWALILYKMVRPAALPAAFFSLLPSSPTHAFVNTSTALTYQSFPFVTTTPKQST